MSRSSILRLFLAVAMLASAMPAHADWTGLGLDNVKPPEMKYGPVEFHPYLKLSEIYDSNIFLNPSHGPVVGNNANNNLAGPQLGSWIHTLNAGVKVGAQIAEMHRLDLAYDMVYKAYSKDPRSNNTVNQGVDAMYSYKGPMGFGGHLKDTYVNTVDPATSELTQRTRRWNNTAGIDGEYAPEGGNLFGGVDLNESVDKYVSNPATAVLLDRYTQLFGFKAGYLVMPKTRAYLAYHRQVIHYTDHPGAPSKNNKAHLLDFGVEGELAPKLTGQVQTGLQYRNYDDAPTVGAKRITRNWMVATNLNYRPLERTKATLSLSRSLQESTFGANQFYIASSAGLNVTHKLPWKVTAGVNAGIEQDKYPLTSTVGTTVVNRRDDLYQVGANLDYDIQEWLKAGLNYEYRTRFSHALSEQFNYRDHVTGITIGATF
jgi:hypothetical protein